MVLMPTAWSLSAFSLQYDGTAFDAGSGPGASGRSLLATATLTAQETQLLNYLDAHKGGASYVMATTSWNGAAPYIEATGQKLLPMGGFSGSVPEPTLAKFKQLVQSGQLKFVMVGGASGPGGGGASGTSTVSSITTWVQSACATVPATDYGGTTSSSSSSGGFGGFGGFGPGGGGGTGTLYQCSTSAK